MLWEKLEQERKWRSTYYTDIQIPDGKTLLAVNDRNVVVRRYEESTANKKKDDDGKSSGYCWGGEHYHGQNAQVAQIQEFQ